MHFSVIEPLVVYLGTQRAVISASSLKVSSPRPQVSVTEMQKKMKKTGNLRKTSEYSDRKC